jgi:hypothetical protein
MSMDNLSLVNTSAFAIVIFTLVNHELQSARDYLPNSTQ